MCRCKAAYRGREERLRWEGLSERGSWGMKGVSGIDIVVLTSTEIDNHSGLVDQQRDVWIEIG
jgi:hypothetical protein